MKLVCMSCWLRPDYSGCAILSDFEFDSAQEGEPCPQCNSFFTRDAEMYRALLAQKDIIAKAMADANEQFYEAEQCEE